MNNIVAKESNSHDKSALTSMTSRPDDSIGLPETCTLLRTENGGRVYVVGICHYSRESAEDVASVIQNVRPDIVVLELCEDRKDRLYQDQDKSISLMPGWASLIIMLLGPIFTREFMLKILMAVVDDRIVRSLE